ncbi:enoyl-CoA hydratase-related protein [Gordonia sp. HY285]|uniref:acetyl-CoA acetyltransferase n=1 Tax=Gordonia liuliyuniae TaxID=2911517 RepID=UPI001EFF2B9D|nr:acetyl-CoA acetyltransferase [Gordonia liuliyuniae]MCF8610276.1 enoyl-CoA hydratase-related protein [Gordonia liuliyuniae]
MDDNIAAADIDPTTPIIVGVGQASERLDDPDYQRLGEADLAAIAVRAAFADTGVDAAAVTEMIDVAAAVRSFEKSSPASSAQLGRPDNMPRAVAKRTGMDPRRAVEEVTGGQSPQHLVTEFGTEIAAGLTDAVLLFGCEVMSTVRAALKSDDRPDYSETVGGQLEDRGFGIAGLTSVDEVRHGVMVPLAQYSILENARRHRLGRSRTEYAAQMGALFAPMSQIAAQNPYSSTTRVYSAADLAVPGDDNRRVCVPYTRRLVSRDQVNQAAAVVMTSVGAARRAGIDPSRWVFLHGYADLCEKPMMRRPDLSQAPSAVAAVHTALTMAGIGMGDVGALDLYSCFPIAVSNVADAFGLEPDDPRGLTATGGLPYFGGPGNNYSMHGIAEIVEGARRTPGSYGLVGANGGILSKYSVGVYSTTPTPWRRSPSDAVQRELDTAPNIPITRYADGRGVIESFTVLNPDRADRAGTVIGRLHDGTRFVATAEGDDLLDLLCGQEDPIGRTVYARSSADRNVVTLTRTELDERHPRTAPRFADDYEHLIVERRGRVLEVTINRPDSRNAISPKTNAELDAVFEAYFADPDLWVAILTGAGDKAFSSGNDLAASAGGTGLSMPENGFAGLTARTTVPKPVIAAVNGFALGGGLEIALACHVIVADESATFGLPEVKVGLVAAAGGLVRLPRAVPRALARDMILTGRRLDADEALAHGLVSRIAPKGDVMATARGVAEEMLAASPAAVRASISTMAAADATPDTVTAVRDSLGVLDEILVSPDTTEGIMAFVQKRPPQWTGR